MLLQDETAVFELACTVAAVRQVGKFKKQLGERWWVVESVTYL